MCQYKILNLSTGKCYNNNLPDFQHDLPEIVYQERVDAELDLIHITKLNIILANHNVKSYHLEIIEVEDTDASQEA
jgi:hypothetical protein